jgi:putative membrane protein
MDEANPGQTNQGKMHSGNTAQMTPDVTVGKTADATFAKKAAAGGMAEVKLGQLAQEKGSSQQVKDFGKRMETDHTKAGDQLMQMASRDNIDLPNGLEAKDQSTYDKLSKLSGAAFDREYMQDMVTDHEKDVAEFKREANVGKNPDMKTFASETLPTLQSHLQQARKVAKSVGAAAGSGASMDKNGSPTQ